MRPDRLQSAAGAPQLRSPAHSRRSRRRQLALTCGSARHRRHPACCSAASRRRRGTCQQPPARDARACPLYCCTSGGSLQQHALERWRQGGSGSPRRVHFLHCIKSRSQSVPSMRPALSQGDRMAHPKAGRSITNATSRSPLPPGPRPSSSPDASARRCSCSVASLTGSSCDGTSRSVSAAARAQQVPWAGCRCFEHVSQGRIQLLHWMHFRMCRPC